jgi:TonB family protein
MDERVIEAEQATAAPVLLSAVTAGYPEEARQQGIEVDVVLSLVVRTDGTVGRVTVVDAAGFGFDEAAVAAARRFRFRPALLGDVPIAVRLRWVYQFRLQ